MTTVVREFVLLRPFAVSTKHGTLNAYNNYGCRCEECREAQRAHRREPLGPEDSRHGTESSYNNHACRCRLCTDARSAAVRQRRARAREARRAPVDP